MSILWSPAEATVVEKVSLPVITTGTQNMGNGIYWLKAGTPLSNAYAVANNGNAKYIVAEDFFFVSTNPNQERAVPIVKAGYVDLNAAEAAAGITFADAAVAALKTAGIELVDGLLEAGGGGGGNVLIVHGTVDMSQEGEDQEYPMTIDKTLAEIAAVDYSVLVVDMVGGFYELPEVARGQNEGTLTAVTWGVQIGGQAFIAAFQDGEGFFQMTESDSPILTVHPVLGTENEDGYPVTGIDKTYDEIDAADMAYAEVSPPDLGAFKLPLVLKLTTPNYIQLAFSASSVNSTAQLMLSFSASTHEFDASASAFTVQ